MNDLPPCIQNIGLDRAPSCLAEHCQHARSVGCTGRELKPRQLLFVEGDPHTHVYLVRRGAISLYRMLRNGRRQVVGFKLPGEFIGLGYEEEYRFCAEAIGPTEVRVFQGLAFHCSAVQDSRFLLKLYESVAGDLARAHEQALSVGQRDAEGSVAAFLLNVEGRTADLGSEGFFALPMPRADIADYLGISLETVSRVLTGLKRHGFIGLSGRRGLRIVNRNALRALAEGFDRPSVGHSTPALVN